MRRLGGPGGWGGPRARLRAENEVGEELRFHLEGRARELMAEGWPEGEARAEAARRFGDVSRIEAQCRTLTMERMVRERRMARLETLCQDVRSGVRSLRRSGGFTPIAVATLALGIGVTTAIFTVVDSVLLRPLPLGSPERLVVVWERNADQGIERERPSAPDFTDFRESSRRFAGMTAWTEVSLTVTGVAEPDVLFGVAATASFFDVLGVAPELGRTFAPGEDDPGAARVVVLGHGAWRDRFGGDPGVVGQPIELDQVPYEVIGVMPADFGVPSRDVDVWVPARHGTGPHRQSRYLQVVGRLGEGVTIEQASAELNAIAERLDETYPESNDGWRVALVPLHEEAVGSARTILLVVFAAVGFVLVLACVNVANLVLGRSIGRAPEMAIRAALGASAGRLRSQGIVENVMLGMLGGGVGLVLAEVGVRVFLSLEPAAVPRAEEIAADLRVLAFVVATSVVTGVVFGLIPGLRPGSGVALGREDWRQVGGRRANAIRRGLIVAEVALSLVLLGGAGLAIRSLLALRSVDPGYQTADVLAGRIDLDDRRYAGNSDRVLYFERLIERLGSVPGVEVAAVTSTLPLTHGIDFNLPYRAEGHPDLPEGQLPQADYRVVSPGYVEAMGMAVRSGRSFGPQDRVGSRRVLMVNEAFARAHWPGQEAVGKRVRIYYVTNDDFEVVGVVGDTRHLGLATPAAPQMFVPLGQADIAFSFMTVVVRRVAGLAGVERAIRAAALELDPSEPLYLFQTMEGLVSEITARERLVALVFALFAALAVVLSAAGIYGVISYQVARRTREIGVRMALGAARSRVISSVVGEVAMLAGAGIVIGLVVAAAATRFVSGRLFGITPMDPATFSSVSGLLLVVAVLAALVPALRAATIQPIQALRPD